MRLIPRYMLFIVLALLAVPPFSSAQEPKQYLGDPAGNLLCLYGGEQPSISTLEGDVMSNVWFARPVLFVADIERSVDFYVNQLGFSHPWRYEEEGKARVAQVERQGCELILSSQWPDKVGKGLMFISLDVEVLNALRAELEGRGVDVKDGNWGYRLMVIVDPDRNELYFPYPSDADRS
jgi:catechol 2,3-dioxygenase-like lactoylglutathione lyase family enzyme